MSNATGAAQGRPRDTRRDAAILDAALELLIDGGVEAVKVDVVAKRSGVSRGTVYRRHPTHSALVVDAVAHCYRSITLMEALEEPTVDEMVEGISLALAEPRGRRLLRRLVSVPRDHPKLFAQLRGAVGTPDREKTIRQVLARAAAQHRFGADTDLEMVQTLFSAAMVAHLFTEPDDVTVADVRDHLFQVLRALGYRKDTR